MAVTGYEDASIDSATGSSQEIVPANRSRNFVLITNIDAAESWWINESGGTAAADTEGSIEIAPGEQYVSYSGSQINGIATATTKLTVKIA